MRAWAASSSICMLEALTCCELCVHAIQRQTHQQGHDPQQAKAGEQGDFPLNGQLPERHRDILNLKAHRESLYRPL